MLQRPSCISFLLTKTQLYLLLTYKDPVVSPSYLNLLDNTDSNDLKNIAKKVVYVKKVELINEHLHKTFYYLCFYTALPHRIFQDFLRDIEILSLVFLFTV